MCVIRRSAPSTYQGWMHSGSSGGMCWAECSCECNMHHAHVRASRSVLVCLMTGAVVVHAAGGRCQITAVIQSKRGRRCCQTKLSVAACVNGQCTGATPTPGCRLGQRKSALQGTTWATMCGRSVGTSRIDCWLTWCVSCSWPCSSSRWLAVHLDSSLRTDMVRDLAGQYGTLWRQRSVH